MLHYRVVLHNDPHAAAAKIFINAIMGLLVDGVGEV